MIKQKGVSRRGEADEDSVLVLLNMDSECGGSSCSVYFVHIWNFPVKKLRECCSLSSDHRMSVNKVVTG